MPANERAHGVRARIAELRYDNKVEDIELSHLADAREEIDFLHEVQQPRDVHETEQRRRNGQQARRAAFRQELADAQSEHEEDEEAGLEVVHPRRGIIKTQLARAV